MALEQTPVSRSLERKLKILGFEIPDLLAIFIFLSALNFIFSSSAYSLLLTWGPSFAFALILRLSKRGKPDGYIVHFLKFHFSHKYFSSFNEATSPNPVIKRKKER